MIATLDAGGIGTGEAVAVPPAPHRERDLESELQRVRSEAFYMALSFALRRAPEAASSDRSVRLTT